MNHTIQRLLVVDDDPAVRSVVCRLFSEPGYQVAQAADGFQALDMASAQPPDLVVLDHGMPGMTGREVCSRLRAGPRTRHIPILMLSGWSDTQDRVEGLRGGADDYVAKPAELQELRARVEALLARSQSYLAANPLTRLPGSPAVEEEVQRRIQAGAPLALAYADLDSFKAYNDVYGYHRGDQAIRAAASILVDAAAEHGAPGDLVGHIGGDDFALVSDPGRIIRIAERAVHAFDRERLGLYEPADRERGWIEAHDRRGEARRFPLLTISIGIATNERRRLEHYAKAVEIATEMKRFLKSLPGPRLSRFAADRRSD